MRARYGVSLVIQLSDSLSATVIAVSCVIWWWIRPCYNSTWLYSIQYCEISHQTLGPSHRKCPKCPMIFVNTGIGMQTKIDQSLSVAKVSAGNWKRTRSQVEIQISTVKRTWQFRFPAEKTFQRGKFVMFLIVCKSRGGGGGGGAGRQYTIYWGMAVKIGIVLQKTVLSPYNNSAWIMLYSR